MAGEGTIVGYQFVVGDPAIIKKGDRKGEQFTPLSFVPEVHFDGADDDVTQTQRLLIGDADNFGEVSEDGQTLMTPEGQNIGANTEAGIFLATLCEAGFDESRLSEDADRINYEPILGTRVKLAQVINEEKTKRQGKQKSKDGTKEYMRTDLKVIEVLAQPMPVPGSAKKTITQAANKKPNGKAVEVDIDTLADTVVAKVVEKAGGTLQKRQLAAKVQVTLTAKGMPDCFPYAKQIRERILEDDYLASANDCDIIVYHAKKQLLEASA